MVIIITVTIVLFFACIDFFTFDGFKDHKKQAEVRNAVYWLSKYKLEVKRGSDLLGYVQHSHNEYAKTVKSDSFDYFNICIIERRDPLTRNRIKCADCQNTVFCSDEKYGYLVVAGEKTVTLNISNDSIFSDLFPSVSEDSISSIQESFGDIFDIQKW